MHVLGNQTRTTTRYDLVSQGVLTEICSHTSLRWSRWRHSLKATDPNQCVNPHRIQLHTWLAVPAPLTPQGAPLLNG